MKLIKKQELFDLNDLVFLKLFNEKKLYRSLKYDILIIEKIYDYVDIKSIKKLVDLENCKNIQTIFAVYKKQNSIISYEKFIYGLDLANHLNHNGDYSQKQYLKIFYGIASGLKLLHDNNIIHRDIKPDNIIVDDKDNGVLIDFGIIREENNLDKNKDTRLLGTQGYASPEQYGFSPTTSKSDIYSLGICMQEILVNTSINDIKIQRLIADMIDINPDKRINIDGVLERLEMKKNIVDYLFYYSPFIKFDANVFSCLYYWFFIMVCSFGLSGYTYTQVGDYQWTKRALIVGYIGFLYLFKLYDSLFKHTYFSLKVKYPIIRHFLFVLELAIISMLILQIIKVGWL